VRRVVFFLLVASCAAGPRDVLDSSGGNGDASAPPPQTAYAYIARRSLVTVALADSQGVVDDDTHQAIDRVADYANACMAKSKNLVRGAMRVVLPIDDGGVAGIPQVTYTPPESAPLGLLCVIRPIRMSSFGPATNDAGARGITIESVWGQ
jgi:hypothetical protein